MFSEKGLSFEIVEAPVLYTANGSPCTANGHKVIHKDTDGEVISVMKKSYFPMYNADFVRSVEQMSEISGFKISGYSEIYGGAVVLAHLKNTDPDFKINSHSVQDYLILGNSFDGRTSFFIGTTSVLIRCQNQFSRISQLEKVRHTKSCPKKVEELFQALGVYFDKRTEMYENFEKFNKVHVDEELRNAVLDRILEISEEDRQLDKISTRKQNQLATLRSVTASEMAEIGDNLWGLFNGVTRYTTHEIQSKNSGFGLLFGTPADINNRAYNLALQMV